MGVERGERESEGAAAHPEGEGAGGHRHATHPVGENLGEQHPGHRTQRHGIAGDGGHYQHHHEETGDVLSCTFENGTVAEGYDPYGYGTRTSRNGNTILYLDLIDNPGHDDNGAVNEQTANGKENRLKSSEVVSITTVDGNPQIQITGFNFKAMYCGLEGEDVPRGRKLVIKIPIRVKEGSWGDGFITNGPMSYVTPDGGTTIYPFEVPVINVIGSVWSYSRY